MFLVPNKSASWAGVLVLTVSLAEKKISQMGKPNLLLLQDTAIILKRESERLAAERENLDSQVDRIEQVLERLSVAKSAEASTSLEALQHRYGDLRTNFAEEYILYNLPAIALSQVSHGVQCPLRPGPSTFSVLFTVGQSRFCQSCQAQIKPFMTKYWRQKTCSWINRIVRKKRWGVGKIWKV